MLSDPEGLLRGSPTGRILDALSLGREKRAADAGGCTDGPSPTGHIDLLLPDCRQRLAQHTGQRIGIASRGGQPSHGEP